MLGWSQGSAPTSCMQMNASSVNATEPTGAESPMANLLLSVMGAFVQFERELIRERQREGILLAKKRGIYKGRKRSLTAAQVAEVVRRVKADESVTIIAREFKVSRNTVYLYIRREGK